MCTTEYKSVYHLLPYTQDYPADAVVKNPPASAGDAWDVSSIPGSGRSPGVGNSNLRQYSCLKNSMDRGAWQTTALWISKSQTWLSARAHTHTHRVGHDWVCARAHTHTHTHTPNSWPPFTHFAHPPESPFPTGNHYSVLSVSLFLFYFVCWILLCLRFHIWVQSYSVCLWLTSLSVMPSGSILVTDGKISFFMAGNIEIYLFESVFPCSLEKIPRSRVAGSCSVLFLIFWGNPYYFL